MNFAESIEYVGNYGVTCNCVNAIKRYLFFGDTMKSAKLLSDEQHRHAFLLDINETLWVAVRSGFASGYNGEGSAALAFILLLLQAFNVEIVEYKTKSAVIDRLNKSSLSERDVDFFRTNSGATYGWHEYIYNSRHRMDKPESTWATFPKSIPYALIDVRIFDLVNEYNSNPDACLVSGFRRLEEILKKRTNTNLIGTKLCDAAFKGDQPALSWKTSKTETASRTEFFRSAFAMYRNRRAHNELKFDESLQLNELITMNLLFLMEGEAVPNDATNTATNNTLPV